MKKKADISINIMNETNINNLIEEKIKFIQQIIRNSLISIQNYKKYEIFSNSELIICISSLNELYEKTNNIIEKINVENTEIMIDLLQTIIDKLSIIISGFGTQNFDELIYITFGSEFNNFKSKNTQEMNDKFELINQYIHPIGFKTIQVTKKNNNDDNSLCSNKIIDEIYEIEKYPMLECFDVDIATKSFYNKVYGIRVVIHSLTNKTIIVNGIIDDLNLAFFSNKYIQSRKQEIINYIPNTEYYKSEIINRLINSMTLKDILIYGNNDILKKYSNIVSVANSTLSNKLEITVKKFIELDIYSQRNTIIDLLIYNGDYEVQYVTYLLYDLITVDPNNMNDSNEQKIIYDSLSWKIKNYFKDAMKNTVKYTQDMNQKYDISRISLEQQIYVLKIPDNVKEKAMIKLKEVKGKPDESCAKAKQYLEGLLKIPFNTYKEENILKITKQINTNFSNIIDFFKKLSPDFIINKKKYYTNLEISKIIENMKLIFRNIIMNKPVDKLSIKQINSIIQCINNNSSEKIIWSKFKNKLQKTNEIHKVINNYSIENRIKIIDIIETENEIEIKKNKNNETETNSFFKKYKEIENIENNIKLSKEKIENISKILDESIYGHSYAKNQILKIICQWISGEQSGYCFGFEGSPGIGKTSLAKKGLANCLADDNSDTRPFSFIALGGSCNGSILEGHSYTYVNSTWGRITDILMESKCMNPIIYIDELDKVSKSEHGKEIIGILTHLIDTTQNDTFQDKYFSGINLDLSKALFIFSYNDASQIDPILLDRIHRIKFENLTSVDKLVIVKKYIIPEINKKMGFNDIVEMTDTVIEYIIENYTMEPGVRKLKEILFDLYGELNIELLKCNDCHINIPIIITIDDLENKYLKKYKRVIEKIINSSNEIGIINGLWANSLGKGGIISIESVFFPCYSFLELKLTGLQGDVMKESMNVAKTIAWNLTPTPIKTKLINNFEKTKCQGIHVNCPEASVSKDGPSAGAAITIAMYSLLNNIPIKNDVAITGEINLQGKITAIGGLDNKIMGGLQSGIKKFLFPKENSKDFIDFIKKYGEKPNIEFIEISNIQDIFPHVFV